MCTACYTSDIWHTQIVISPNNKPIDKDRFVLCRGCGELIETGMVNLSEHYSNCKGAELAHLVNTCERIEWDYLIDELFDSDLSLEEMIQKLKKFFKISPFND